MQLQIKLMLRCVFNPDRGKNGHCDYDDLYQILGVIKEKQADDNL
jgi:hypothetical protein